MELTKHICWICTNGKKIVYADVVDQLGDGLCMSCYQRWKKGRPDNNVFVKECLPFIKCNESDDLDKEEK